ncbi:MAG: 50S ribosome-binding GTPase [Thermoplasmata archaeon]|nr:50S ribosome-binding GTPase [Thermoplasmata archaeon]
MRPITEGRPPPSVEILDAAFRKAHRASAHGTTRLDRSRRNAKLRIVRSSAIVLRLIRGLGKSATTPPLSELDHRLLNTHFPEGSLERSMRRLRTAEGRIRRLLEDEERRLSTLATEDDFGDLVRRTYGRLASYIQEIDPDLERLHEIVRFRRDRPEVLPGVPSVVVAGFPNVGKSSLVARLSSAKPEVAPYAFTTRAIVVGHTDLGFDRLQVVDTPGVLGRAARANEAEQEALAVVGTNPTVIVFVLDPSGTSGYPLVDQERLLERWKTEFPRIPIVAVETKADLGRSNSDRLAVSAVSGVGIDALRKELQRLLAQRAVPVPAEPSGDIE